MSDGANFFHRFSLEQRILAGFGLALGILALIGVLQYRTTQALIETALRVRATSGRQADRTE